VTDTPFTRSSSLSLQQLPVTFGLSFFDDHFQGTALELLSRILYKDSSASEHMSPEAVAVLPSWCLIEVIKAYSTYQKLWQEYFQKEISSFCKTHISHFYWTLLSTIGEGEVFPFKTAEQKTLNTEQRLWVYFASSTAQEEAFEFTISIRDSLLPWLNPKMFQEVQEKKKNTRQNAQYDQDHAAMVLGQGPSSEEEDELDIVK
jgi:hypothetical protein